MSGGMHELAKGIWRIPTSRGDRDNAFLVEADDGYTLVDVGWGGAPGRIAAALAEHGRTLTDIRRIVLTHAHPDHVKGAAELRERSGAPILIHAAEAAWLSAGRVPSEGRSGAAGRALDRLPLLHWTPLKADQTLTDGQAVDATEGLSVIHTPGHSPGHIILVHEPTKTALMGDAVFHRSGLALGPAALAAAPATRVHSLRHIPSHVTTIGFAHGAPITEESADGFHAFLRQAGTAAP